MVLTSWLTKILLSCADRFVIEAFEWHILRAPEVQFRVSANDTGRFISSNARSVQIRVHKQTQDH
jgi:hypothetical protein